MIVNITLEPAELALCTDYAHGMYKRHEATPQGCLVLHDDPAKRQRLNLDIISKASEAAVAEYLGLSAEYSINQIKGGDYGIDLIMPLSDGTIATIDIKSSTHPEASRLLWPMGKSVDKMADVLVFVKSSYINSSTWGTFELCGWITGWQFLKLASIANNDPDLKDGTRFMYDYTLTPMKFLK